jgi:trehalose synthase
MARVSTTRRRRAKLQSVPVEQRALDAYRGIAPDELLDSLQQRARALRGARLLHVNATAHGGGVAELLRGIVPLMRALGIVADWRVISGDHDFFRITKTMHNALQGDPEGLSPQDEETYVRTVERNAALFDGEYDFVFVHDPQPLAFPMFRAEAASRWIWRCHIDTSAPNPQVWKYVRKFLPGYHAAVFTLDEFVPADLPVERAAVIPVAIDPLSPKNLDVSDTLARTVIEWLGISSRYPLVAQVARFDPWKDPLGVVEAYRTVRKEIPGLQLALVGAMVADDPEGQKIRDEVTRAVADDPLIHIVSSGVGNLEVNAIQRKADVFIQKSIREGFGLVVSEALWKETPVVAGRVGGIPLQIEDGVSGFLVSSIEECAGRVLQVLKDPALGRKLGKRGRQRVRERFLLPRLVLDDVTLLSELTGAREFVRAPQWLLEHDPVCGARLSELRFATAHYDGASYRFCSDACAARFGFDPLHYIPPSAPTEPAMDRSTNAAPQEATANAETDLESS